MHFQGLTLHTKEALLEYGNAHFLQVKRYTSVQLANLLNCLKVAGFSKKLKEKSVLTYFP